MLLRDNTIWPAAVLEELLQVPSVELIPTHLAAPLYSFDQSIPNPIAYVPQFGSGLYPIMVCNQLMPLPVGIQSHLHNVLGKHTPQLWLWVFQCQPRFVKAA